MPIDLLLDALVAVLLVVTSGYCFILDRRLRELRSGQDGMKEIIRALNQATEQAQSAIAHLKISGDAAGHDLRETVSKARALADELSLMLESGNNIADRLEGSASQAMIQNNDALRKLKQAASQGAGDSESDDALIHTLRQTR